MLIGYARVSTEDQKLDLQKDALTKAGVDPERIYEEYVSGAKTRRPQLEECIKSCRDGDTLIVWRLDRLGRNLPELIKLLDRLKDKGVGFRSLNESIDTTTAVGKMVFHMLGAVAQFERDLVSERTKAGLKAARARGSRGGRKPKLGAKQLKMIKAMLSDESITMEEVASAFKVSPATVYRAINREKEEESAKELKAVLRKRARHNKEEARRRASEGQSDK